MPGKKKPSRKTGRDRNWHAAQRRRESHNEATAHAQQQQVAAIPDHPLICADDAELITEVDALDDLIAHVREVGSFAYDTEFIGELSYFPQLCVVQIATSQRVALVDPLVGLDLTGVWELIADEAIEVLVHAGQQDLEPVVRHLGKPPANIFDTQVAAGFIGMGYPTGLGKLVEVLLDVSLGKGLTYTAWDHRPLSKVHQRYAADDVRYLPALKAEIERRAAEREHTDWLNAECASLCRRSLYEPNPIAALARLRGSGNLSSRKQYIAAALLALRDTIAREENTPPRTIMGDDVVMALTRKPVDSIEKLSNIRGLPRNLVESNGHALIDAIAEGSAKSGPPLVPPKAEESTLQRLATDALWSAACSYCLGRGIDPQLVASRAQFSAWYTAVQSGKPAQDSPLASGWRETFLGQFLQSFLDGKAHVMLQWSDQSLQASVIEPDA